MMVRLEAEISTLHYMPSNRELLAMDGYACEMQSDQTIKLRYATVLLYLSQSRSLFMQVRLSLKIISS
jgi:hypothetical protein